MWIHTKHHISTGTEHLCGLSYVFFGPRYRFCAQTAPRVKINCPVWTQLVWCQDQTCWWWQISSLIQSLCWLCSAAFSNVLFFPQGCQHAAFHRVFNVSNVIGPSQSAPGQYPNYPQGQGQQYGGYRPPQPGPPQGQQQRPYGYDQVSIPSTIDSYRHMCVYIYIYLCILVCPLFNVLLDLPVYLM